MENLGHFRMEIYRLDLGADPPVVARGNIHRNIFGQSETKKQVPSER